MAQRRFLKPVYTGCVRSLALQPPHGAPPDASADQGARSVSWFCAIPESSGTRRPDSQGRFPKPSGIVQWRAGIVRIASKVWRAHREPRQATAAWPRLFSPNAVRPGSRCCQHPGSASGMQRAANKALPPTSVLRRKSRRRIMPRLRDRAGGHPHLLAARSICEYAVVTHLAFATLQRLENLKIVVVEYVCPGLSVVDGNLGWLGESGKCWVSRQNP